MVLVVLRQTANFYCYAIRVSDRRGSDLGFRAANHGNTWSMDKRCTHRFCRVSTRQLTHYFPASLLQCRQIKVECLAYFISSFLVVHIKPAIIETLVYTGISIALNGSIPGIIVELYSLHFKFIFYFLEFQFYPIDNEMAISITHCIY